MKDLAPMTSLPLCHQDLGLAKPGSPDLSLGIRMRGRGLKPWSPLPARVHGSQKLEQGRGQGSGPGMLVCEVGIPVVS